jgi:hypothetical protein
VQYTVLTYDADDNALSQWTSQPGYDDLMRSVGVTNVPEQLATNALDLPGAVLAKVWEGSTPTGDPVLTRAAGQ